MKKRVVGGGERTAGVVGSSFRELDDVFLQTQARIWLGEVLHLRFDEETSMADLIADGELLFQVSKILWKKLVKINLDLKQSKLHIYEKTSSGKNDGLYLRYTKVDSFLKICQILGLAGIDLFTPSDVVDKRDTRKVCMCIRSVSMKSRSKYLNVPDFDVVTYTIAMPNYLVGGICKNLIEKSKSSSSISSSYRQKDSSENFEQSQGELHYDSDEAESCLSEIEFRNPKISNSAETEFESPNPNSHSDIIQSDLHEEIGEKFTEISEEKKPISEKEISEINTRHFNNDELLASTSSSASCESSVGDSWQGQDGNFTPESKLVVKNEVKSEMDSSSERLSDGKMTETKIMEISSERISDGENSRVSVTDSLKFELEKGEDIFNEELIANYDDPNLEDIVADFCKTIGSENELSDLDFESEVLDLNCGDLSGQNVEQIDQSEFSPIQNLTFELEHKEEQGEKIEEELNEEKDKVVNSTEIKADDELETEKVIEECENKDLDSEENSKNKIQNQNLGQKVLTSVAGGVTLAGVLLIFLQMRKRSKGSVAIGLQSPIKETKEESYERNNIEIQKPNTVVYPGQWLKI